MEDNLGNESLVEANVDKETIALLKDSIKDLE